MRLGMRFTTAFIIATLATTSLVATPATALPSRQHPATVLTASKPARPAFTLSTSNTTIGTADFTTVAEANSTGGSISRFTISPNLPAGLSLSASSGVISGRPKSGHSKTKYTVTAYNAAGRSSRSIFITVIAAPKLMPSTLYAGLGLKVRSFKARNTGGNGSTYEIQEALPKGLALNKSSGSIFGTPTSIQKLKTYHLTASNISGSSTRVISIEIVKKPTISLTKASLLIAPGAMIPSLGLKNTGGRVFSYSVTPSLPAGLALNSTTGVISGRPTTPQVRTGYTLKALNPGGSSSVVVSIEVLAPPAFIISSIVVAGVNGALTQYTLASMGGLVASWSISPALPAGLTFNATTGAITGHPTQAQSASTYTVTATNVAGTASHAFTLEVVLGPSFDTSVTSVSAPLGLLFSGYSLTSRGGRISSWSISPSLPSGLTLDTATGLISGTPTDALPLTVFTLTAANPGGQSSQTVSIEIVAPPVFSLISTLESVAVGHSMAGYTITNTGGAPSSYVLSPSIPSWMNFNAFNGLLTGIADTVQDFITWTLTATNIAGSYSRTFRLEVVSTPSISLSNAFEEVAVGSPIAGYTITSTGGRIANFSVTPELPAGLIFNSSTGIITGAPTSAQTAITYTVLASNAAGQSSATFTLRATTTPIFSLSAATEELSLGSPLIGFSLSNSGGHLGSYSIAPAVPSGTTFDSVSGSLSGTPTSVLASTTFTISGTNAAGTHSETFTLAVVSAPAFTINHSAEEAAVNTAIRGFTATSTGGVVSGYSITPEPQAGLTFNSTTGTLSGTPSVANAPLTFTISSQNAAGVTSRTFTLSVVTAPSFTLSASAESLPKNTALTGYSVISSGGVVSSYSITPAPPTGVLFDSSTGRLSGTPTTPQNAMTYTISASNAAGSASAQFDITITNPPAFTLSLSSAIFYLQEVIASSYSITSTGGPVTSYSLSPDLPAGVTFDTATGLLSGTPTEAASATSFTVVATNTAGTASRSISIEFKRSCATGGTCSVGETGPGGGYVFYVSALGFSCGLTMSDTCHYLELAPNTWNGGLSDPTSAQAGTGNSRNDTTIISPLIDATSNTIGRGRYNTSLLIQWGGSTTAAQLAANYHFAYKGNDLHDWYLPTRGEFTVMGTPTGIYAGSGGGEKYWESDANPSYWGPTAWTNSFTSAMNGGGFSTNKPTTTAYRVRPIRAG